MAYSTGDAILDDHYNAFATSVNAVWGTGTGDAGYGQGTVVTAVDTSTAVAASQWVTLLARITSMGSHQGTSITSITNPAAGDVIGAIAAISTNIAAVTTGRLSVAARQSAVTTNRDQTATFVGTLTYTHKWAWGSTAQARYFFNAGGRVGMSGSLTGHTSDTKADNWASLLTAAGAYLITAQASGKSGGSGSAATNDTNKGYYDLTATYVTVFKQLEDTSPYNTSFVQWQARTQASAAAVEVSCTWVDSAADSVSFNKSIYNVLDQVDGTQRMAFTSEKHNTTHVSDAGGTITVSGTVGHA